jgi:hypothetical protein
MDLGPMWASRARRSIELDAGWHRRGLAAKAAAQAQAAAASDRASSRILLEKACAGRNDLSELVE